MDITVTRKRDAFGTTLTATCLCGAPIEGFVESGAQVSHFPGPFPDDLECDACGRSFNGSGQEVNNRASDFDPADAGERWDDDY